MSYAMLFRISHSFLFVLFSLCGGGERGGGGVVWGRGGDWVVFLMWWVAETWAKYVSAPFSFCSSIFFSN